MPDQNLLRFPWYAVANDLIGGWCVHTVDVPCSQLDYEHREDHREVACFTSEADARHIAQLHNEYLAQIQEQSRVE